MKEEKGLPGTFDSRHKAAMIEAYSAILQEKDAIIEKLMGLLEIQYKSHFALHLAVPFKTEDEKVNHNHHINTKWNEYKLKNGLSE